MPHWGAHGPPLPPFPLGHVRSGATHTLTVSSSACKAFGPVRYVGVVSSNLHATFPYHLSMYEFQVWTKHHFQLAGSQVDAYSDVTEFEYSTDGVWQKITVPVGVTPFYAGGVFSHLAVLQDCDAGAVTARMKIRNVKIHDPVAPLGSIIIAGAVSSYTATNEDITSVLSNTCVDSLAGLTAARSFAGSGFARGRTPLLPRA